MSINMSTVCKYDIKGVHGIFILGFHKLDTVNHYSFIYSNPLLITRY